MTASCIFGGCLFEEELNRDVAEYDPVEIFREFTEQCSSIETSEKQTDDSSGDEPKRKRRKKRMLTGVSRQRRAANARERRRIQGVNRAFVDLKNTLPLAHVDISKIEILRLAVKWIDHLRTLLKDYDERKDLLNTKQLETSRPEEFVNATGEDIAVKHDCLYHQFPDFKNTLWEECIGLQVSYDSVPTTVYVPSGFHITPCGEPEKTYFSREKDYLENYLKNYQGDRKLGWRPTRFFTHVSSDGYSFVPSTLYWLFLHIM